MEKLLPTAAHWGTYRARARNGRLVEIQDYQADPDPSEIGGGMIEAVHHPVRVRRPSVRESFLKHGGHAPSSRRGAERFVEVPWDEALDLAAGHLGRVRQEHGNSAIFGGSYGWASAGRFHHAQSQVHRFLNCIGGYTASIDTYSYAAVSALMPHIVGRFSGFMLNNMTSWDAIAGHCDLMVMFGGMPLKNAQINAGGLGRHTLRHWLAKSRASGTEFVSISPIRSDAPDETDAEWMAPRPNTDTALMMALAHTLQTEGLADQDFLARYTVGYEQLLPYLLGTSDGCAKDANWAAQICQIPAEQIRQLARRMAKGRTMITVAWALQRADHGEQPCWMAVVLAAMLGQIGLPGGGFGIGYGCANGIGNPTRSIRFPALPQKENPISEAIPVARITDALLHPGQSYPFNGATKTYPDLKLIYWAGGNPFHHQMDLGRLVEAFQKPEAIIVNEVWWTATARHADIVFPATTAFERRDISMVRWDPTIAAMEQVIPAQGEARDDYHIFSGLAERLGVAAEFTEGRSADQWVDLLWQQARETAQAEGVELPERSALTEAATTTRQPASQPQVLLAEFRADPDAAPLSTPSGKIEIFSQTIASWNEPSCGGAPRWMAPYEWLGAPDATRFPLHLISNQPATRLHSQLDCGSVSLGSKIQGREPVTLNPLDAKARGISAGDVVKLYNDRGACLAGAVLSEAVMPGVVQLATGAWYDPDQPGNPKALCKHGNPNVLTRDVGTSSLGQGPTAQSTLIEMIRFDGPPPAITAFDPPSFVGIDAATKPAGNER